MKLGSGEGVKVERKVLSISAVDLPHTMSMHFVHLINTNSRALADPRGAVGTPFQFHVVFRKN